MNVVGTLVDAGLTLQSDGDRLLVSPRGRITPEIRAVIAANKPALLAYVYDVENGPRALVDAITRACQLGGDDAQNRLDLIRECGALSPKDQEDAHQHFEEVAAIWARATGERA